MTDRDAKMKSQKNSNKIVVDDVPYRWRANGNDGYIIFTIWPESDEGPAITGNVSYMESWRENGETEFGKTYTSNGDQIVITNRMIRKVILHCIATHQYDPRTSGKQISLRNTDQTIDWSEAIRARSADQEADPADDDFRRH